MRVKGSEDPISGATIYHRVYARIGLLGNPSDGFFGKAISLSLANFCAGVCTEILVFPLSATVFLLTICLSSAAGHADAICQAVLHSSPAARWRRVRLTGRPGAPPGRRRLWGWNPPSEGTPLP